MFRTNGALRSGVHLNIRIQIKQVRIGLYFLVPKNILRWYNKHDIQLSCWVCYDIYGA